MRLIKFGHACVRLEQDDRVLVIDPGTWSEAEALHGASDVLVTHEHSDHVDIDKLVAAREANPALTVYTHEALANELGALAGAVTVVEIGQTFTAAGFTVDVVGGEHAETFDGLPGCANLGFIVEGNVYHPGDSVLVPHERVETLLVPASAPWLKLREALEFVRAVAPRRALPIHDGMLNERGLGNFDNWMRMKGNTDYARLSIGEGTAI